MHILVPVSGLDQEKTLTSISISLWVWTTPKAELQARPLMFPFKLVLNGVQSQVRRTGEHNAFQQLLMSLSVVSLQTYLGA